MIARVFLVQMPISLLFMTLLVNGQQGVDPTTVRRGNTVLARQLSEQVFSAGAAVRMGILIGSGGSVIHPPLGYGFGFTFRYHALPIGPMRFGLEFQAGHTRFSSSERFTVMGSEISSVRVVRWTTLAHTDLTLGPSFQVPLGPIFFTFGGGGGLMVSSFQRPKIISESQPPVVVQELASYDPMVRADVSVGIPIRKNHGLRLGVDLQKVFSTSRIVLDPQAPPEAEPDSVIFDMFLTIDLAYQAWF